MITKLNENFDRVGRISQMASAVNVDFFNKWCEEYDAVENFWDKVEVIQNE